MIGIPVDFYNQPILKRTCARVLRMTVRTSNRVRQFLLVLLLLAIPQHDGQLALVLDGLQLDDALQLGAHVQDAPEHRDLLVVLHWLGFAYNREHNRI
jgi:hypothetical protein